MAEFQIIVTRDIKSNVYSQPMFFLHIGQAIRSFQDECKRKEKDNVLGMHPEDFELLHIGTYDDNTGRFLSAQGDPMECGEHRQLAVGANFKE